METVTFPGRYDSLAKIGELVTRAAREAGLSAESVYAVELAVDEACCNIIDHAYGGEGRGDFQCAARVERGKLTIVLTDRGRPFDPKRVARPKIGAPLSTLKPRGVGLYLMQKMMDEVHYQSSAEAGNVLTLVKRG